MEPADPFGRIVARVRSDGMALARAPSPLAFSDPIASDRRSNSLFDRIFFTRTGIHFA
jgi:hypothetical protein